MVRKLTPQHQAQRAVHDEMGPLVNHADMAQRILWDRHQAQYPDDGDKRQGEWIFTNHAAKLVKIF